MNGIEDRLRDALSAQAATLHPSPRALLPVAELVRSRRPRWQPYAAAAAIAGIAATATLSSLRGGEAPNPLVEPTGNATATGGASPVASPSMPSPSPSTATSPSPSRTVPAFPARVMVVRPLGPAQLLDTGTGRVLATVQLPDGAHATAAAALDERTYYVGHSAANCRGKVVRVDVRDTGNGVALETTPLFRGELLAGRVGSLAVSPDGARLAMSLLDQPVLDGEGRPFPDHPRPCRRASLAVRDVDGSGGRTWRGPHHEATVPDELQSLSFSPDGRTVAYETNYWSAVRVLDLDAADERDDYFKAARTITEPRRGCHFAAPAFQADTGRIAVVRICPPNGVENPTTSELVSFDPADVRVLPPDPGNDYGDERAEIDQVRRLAVLPGGNPEGGLDFDRTGRHFVVAFCEGMPSCGWYVVRGSVDEPARKSWETAVTATW